MILNDEALQVAAQCSSRGEHLTVETAGIIDSGLWCPHCRTHSRVTIALRGIAKSGVYDMGTVTTCTLHDRTEGD